MAGPRLGSPVLNARGVCVAGIKIRDTVRANDVSRVAQEVCGKGGLMSVVGTWLAN